MNKKKKKFPNIVYNDAFNNAVSATTMSMEDFGNMYYKIPDQSFGDKPLVKCKCGKIIEKDKALDGEYCNTTCKYDLENIEEENPDEEGD